MASFTATGFLHEKYDEQQVSEKFRKRELVIEIPGQYPEHIKFQLVQDRCDLLDPYQIGQQVEVSFNLRGRASNKNGQVTYFTNLEAWKIQPVGAAPTAQPATQQRPAAQPARQQPQPIVGNDDNDLPF